MNWLEAVFFWIKVSTWLISYVTSSANLCEIKSFVQNCYWSKIPLEDNAFALLKTSENKVAMLHSSATQWKHKFSLDLFLEDGYLCI